MQGPHGAASGQSACRPRAHSDTKAFWTQPSQSVQCMGLIQGTEVQEQTSQKHGKEQPCPWEIANNCTEHPVTKSRSLMYSASIWEPLRGEERGSCSSEQKNLGLCGLGNFYMWVKMLSITLWSLFFQKIMSCLFENYCKFWNYFLSVHWLRNNLACW